MKEKIIHYCGYSVGATLALWAFLFLIPLKQFSEVDYVFSFLVIFTGCLFFVFLISSFCKQDKNDKQMENAGNKKEEKRKLETQAMEEIMMTDIDPDKIKRKKSF